MDYTYRVIIEPDGKHFHAYAPALKGCHTSGKTIAEAKKHIREAVQVYIEGLVMIDGEQIPKDKSLNKIGQFVTIAL